MDGTNDGVPTQPGKTVTINGVVQAPDIPTLHQEMARLSGLLLDGDRYGLLVADDSWTTRAMLATRGGETLVAPQSARMRGGPTARYSLVFYGPSGRRLGSALTGSTGLPSTTGGLVTPITTPVTITETTTSGVVSLTNLGTLPGPVLARIDGPVTGPVITQLGTGLTVRFAAGFSLAAGEWVQVDMERGEVSAQGQETASRNQQVARGGRGWSRFELGANQWEFGAVAAGAGAKLTIQAWPAWP